MVGVAYGKGVELPEENVQWISADQLASKLRSGGALRILDAREEHEYQQGTIPAAAHLGQSSLMFNRGSVEELLNDLTTCADDIVLFANTAGVGSMAAGRDLWVMAFLAELGVPFSRMARLAGGFSGWSASGGVVSVPEHKTFSSGDLQSFLEQAQLPHLCGVLNDESTQSLRTVILTGRQAALAYFETKHIRLPDRQKLTTALAKAHREGMLG